MSQVNVVPVYCPNPDELLNASYLGAGALGRVESCATQGGTYAELGTFPLVTVTYYYAYYHQAAAGPLWYQVRFSDSGGTKFTAYGTPFQAGGRTTLSSLEHVRRLVNPDAPTDTSHDGELLVYLAQVTDLIHTMIERYFLPDPLDPTATSTLTFDGQWGNEHGYGGAWGGQSYPNRYSRLFVARGVRTITTLKLRYGGTGSPQVTVPSSAYVLRPAAQDRDPGQPAQWVELAYPAQYTFALPGNDVIEIVGTFGYATVPPVIEGISERTVLRAWRARASGLGEGVGPSEAGASYIKWAMSYEDNQLLQSHFSEWPLVR
jgi:hypothetical protein